MATLDVILGAGFSYDAGLPLVWNISQRLQTDFRGKLLRHGSGEWQWIDGKDEAVIYSGRLNSQWVSYAYSLNEIVRVYNSVTGGKITSYEDFYAYVANQPDAWYQDIAGMALYNYEKDAQSPNDIVANSIKLIKAHDILPVIDYLIADMLELKSSDDEIKSRYSGFARHLNKFEKVNIYTLNHDLLIEKLAVLFNLSVTDGFTFEESELINERGEPIQIFKNAMTDRHIKLSKLHGSIDNMKYQIGNEEGSFLHLDGRCVYFKASYFDKHHAQRIDLKTKKPIQLFPPDVVPQFITGINKPNRLVSDYMYKALLEDFQKTIPKSENCLIIGYSYCDPHIDDVIKTLPKSCNVTNVDPKKAFPFDHITNVNNLDYFSNAFPPLP